MNNQENMSSQKDNNHPVTKLKNMQFCDLADKEFKIVVLRTINKLQENREKQLNKTRKTIQEHNKKFNKEIEIIRTKQKTWRRIIQ